MPTKPTGPVGFRAPAIELEPKGSMQVHSARAEEVRNAGRLDPSYLLNYLNSCNLTKMAVVKLRERMLPERGAKRPEMDL
jgi:hypothetical protein